MPLGHHKLSAWYHQLAQQLEAGLPFADALRSSLGTGAPKAALESMAGAIEAGGSIDDVLRSANHWLPLPDILALTASAHAGRMPRTLHNLSKRHADIGAAKRKMVFASLYPLGVLHVGILLLPLVRMIDWEKGFQWNELAYLRGVALLLGPLWLALFGLAALARRESPVVFQLAQWLPAIRGYVRKQALADFSFALANFLDAGVPIGNAWASAGLISRSPALKDAAAAMAALVTQGQAPGAKLAEWSCFPPDFVSLYRTGEATGQLEINLHRLTALYQDSANRALALATMIYPAIMFVGVAGMVAYFVISIYGGYLKMLVKMTE